jgi:sugar O-acyltransferase (sialic acid O-acetyltransferase NeuD family)
MDNTAKELYIIGAGGFGREVADTAYEINKAASDPVYRIAGFIDDDESLWGKTVNGIEVRGGVDWLRGFECGGDTPCAVITIANPRIKESIANKLDGFVEWVNIIHPLALIANTAIVGIGNIVQHFVSVNANTKLGNHCLINSHTVVGHDSVLGDYVSVMPQNGIMGFCELKKRAYIGAGVMMIQNVVIGEDATVGAGAVVIRDVPPRATVVGNPARIIK